MKRDGIAIDRNAQRARDIQCVVALRQLPQAAEQALGPASGEHDLAGSEHPQRRAREHGQLVRLLARCDDRQHVLRAVARGDAELRERTHETARAGRRAQRRAELHQTLVEIAGRRIGRECIDELARARPQRTLASRRLDVIGDPVDTCEHARDIAVDERRTFAKGDRCDRARRVGPDARHGTQLARAARQLACPVARHGLRTRVQISRARVVPEPRPRGENIIERRLRERADRRKLRHPAFPVRDHRLDARLLQHDLADPDRVRIARAAPREISAHRRVVRDDRARDDLGAWHARRVQL